MRALGRLTHPRAALLVAAALLGGSLTLPAQNRIVWSDAEKPIVEQLRGLRSLSDSERPKATLQLALQIRQLPAAAHKELLAEQLANLATEGDAGREALQEVAATLAQALIEQPPVEKPGSVNGAYVALAQLVRYEHVQISLVSPQFTPAMAKLEADDLHRQRADFTLTDLTGKSWTLRELRGKVVLVNFWATWCPPCRKEMPDLEALYQRFGPRGLVILAISDEDAAKVKPFVSEHQFSYPILLDPGRKVNETFQVEGIPKSFLYDREGKLVAQAIDMRTRRQFLAMLAQAGLK
jgi:peroxiredoxin